MNIWKNAFFGSAIIIIILSIIILLRGSSQNMPDSKSVSEIGHFFHKETSDSLTGSIKKILKTKPSAPPPFKKFKNAPITKLPEPVFKGMTVEEALKKRRSGRNYSNKPLSLSQFSQLLFAAQGVTGTSYGRLKRTSPSGGALYPYEIYIVVNNVKDLSRGVYHYVPASHSIELIKKGDFSSTVTDAAMNQQMAGDASVTFILSAIFNRTAFKYGDRAYRYIYIEAGHISENIYLQATSMGLASVCLGAFFDDKVNKITGADGIEEAAIYLHSVGAP